MNRQRTLLRVSCKCAIFSPSGNKVLLADYGREGYGLPGGHVDENETPDNAMRRELNEEIGADVENLKHADFFLHPNGKIILGYTVQYPAGRNKRCGVAACFTY